MDSSSWQARMTRHFDTGQGRMRCNDCSKKIGSMRAEADAWRELTLFDGRGLNNI
jgi:hypothetical protein